MNDTVNIVDLRLVVLIGLDAEAILSGCPELAGVVNMHEGPDFSIGKDSPDFA